MAPLLTKLEPHDPLGLPLASYITLSFVLFLVLGFSILAWSCEAMILASKGAEYAAE